MSDIQPGPELDALIAEKVMGWRRQPNLSFVSEDGLRVAHPGAVPPAMFSPSTNIAHAWEVVEKLIDWSPQIGIDCDGNWGCAFETSTGLCVGRSDLPPHAICLAALKAVQS